MIDCVDNTCDEEVGDDAASEFGYTSNRINIADFLFVLLNYYPI